MEDVDLSQETYPPELQNMCPFILTKRCLKLR